ncbi:5-formyltetrahydrofolate cyclo-ligase [Infirmifilum lucidum]|uniref:5-formyltetrahydrofolate cyclo-ligase n=1 Tax=Infirmifilum lucidum TaxID=2776706 RepID=A0A7L9FIZ5_9CREN|nr:5-formyltetrahydrofolate cyclo-ligase [Infirmifilum lucidum]
MRRVKEEIRKSIWSRLLAERVALPPFPIEGRIPNFRGAEAAARRLVESNIFQDARVVFCNPDTPQRYVREAVLRSGKLLIMASPRLRKGFILVNPRNIPRAAIPRASTIRGAFEYGRFITLDVPPIDLKVAGSVAVDTYGGRVGKGGGFSDLEFGILRTLGAIDDSAPIVTTVHDLQVVDGVPMLKHDVPVDYVVTPTRSIKTQRKYLRPEGIYWDLLGEDYITSIPILRDLRRFSKK